MKKIIFAFLLIITFVENSFSQTATEKWNSKDGLSRLEKSHYKNDFYQMVNYFQPQINPLYCAIASSVIILNSIKNSQNQEIQSQKDLEVKKPESVGGGVMEFKSYSQLTFLNEKTDKIKDRNIIQLKNVNSSDDVVDPGLTLDQLSKILSKIYDLKTKTNHIANLDEKNLQNFRLDLKTILADDRKYILANFDGRKLGLGSAGHISPLAAYDENSDSVLVFDVAGHKNSWYWVRVEDLMKAMNSKDGSKFRGYMIISSK